jgi:hypothetical protein
MSDLVQENAKTVQIRDLAPTQVTVGMREVDIKRQRWREKHSHDAVNYLNRHRLPIVLGPKARHYLIDRHHLALALCDEGISELPVSIVANLSGLGFDDFWKTLEDNYWTHPFDDQGRRRPYNDMPTSVDALIDDPYRSLAGALKRAGGYAKDKAPFSEFRWANFMRSRIPHELIEQHFGRALALAMSLAENAEAAALPGWRRHPKLPSALSKRDGRAGANEIVFP